MIAGDAASRKGKPTTTVVLVLLVVNARTEKVVRKGVKGALPIAYICVFCEQRKALRASAPLSHRVWTSIHQKLNTRAF